MIMLAFLYSFLKQKNNIIAWMLTSFVFFVFLRVLLFYKILWTSYHIPGISFTRKFNIFNEYVFYFFTSIGAHEQFLTIIFSLLGGLNIVLFIIFFRRQRRLIPKRNFIATLMGIILGSFGVGCLSCGVLLIAPLISFLGLGVYLSDIAVHAVAISYIGIFCIIFSSVYMLKKMSNPQLCVPK